MPENNPGEQEKKRFNDLSTDKRIHEHLTNEDDIISEDDIRNVKTDATVLGESESGQPSPLADDEVRDSEGDATTGKSKPDKNHPGMESPWNILDA